MKLEPISLKRSPTHTERWVQDRIAEDPTILGLGDLILKDKERPQANAGRLDLLLQDPETLKRYEVEIQLGSTDESHIIRTIEYWDIERKRYPQYEHAAVIVAEEITARFLNVIQLFNGAIPLIALKMTAYKIGEDHALTFVKVLDEMRYGLVDEDEPVAEPVDRAYWEARSSKKMLSFTDALLKLVQEIEPDATLRYNKYYVGRSDEVDQQLEDAELDTLAYDSQWRQYRLRLSEMVTGSQRDVLLALVRESRESFGRAR